MIVVEVLAQALEVDSPKSVVVHGVVHDMHIIRFRVANVVTRVEKRKASAVVMHDVLIDVPVGESLHRNGIANVIKKSIFPDNNIGVVDVTALRVDPGHVVEDVVVFDKDIVSEAIHGNGGVIPAGGSGKTGHGIVPDGDIVDSSGAGVGTGTVDYDAWMVVVIAPVRVLTNDGVPLEPDVVDSGGHETITI